jgi:hypothetical protein
LVSLYLVFCTINLFAVTLETKREQISYQDTHCAYA